MAIYKFASMLIDTKHLYKFPDLHLCEFTKLQNFFKFYNNRQSLLIHVSIIV